MMLIWAAVVGALFGWAAGGFEAFGFFFGGLIGAALGWWLRSLVRAQIVRATDGLRVELAKTAARLDAVVADAQATAPPPRADPPVAEPIERPAPSIPPRVPRPAPSRTLPPAPAIVTGTEYEPGRSRSYVAPPPPPPPPPPSPPGMIALGFAAARGWLFGGNTVVRVGLVILFVGLALLASYAAAAGLFPIELRLALVAAAGIALLVVGFRSRLRRPDFGLALQGGGVAVIYLTLFGAAKLIEGFPVGAAFVMMIVVCALGCALALLQKSQALAVTSFAGGFAVPLLLSDGGGNIIGLFGYYTILNVAILFIAQRRSWRVLNLVGFFATFGIGGAFGLISYEAADFAVAQTFLIASVLIYVATAVLYTRGTPGKLGNAIDTTLLFGPAIVGFGLEVGLVHDRPFGSAFAAIGFGALYLGVAAFTLRYRRDAFRVMNEAMLALGVGFVTLAIPLALDARWTSAAWALEGAGAFWVGLRQARWMPRLFGLLLQVVAALLFIAGLGSSASVIPLANPAFMGAMLIALPALATAWWLRQPLPHSGSRPATGYASFEATLERPAFVFGFAFWWLAFALEAARAVPSSLAGQPAVAVFGGHLPLLLQMLAFVASAWVWRWIGARQAWRVATWPSYATLVALAFGFLLEIGVGGHVLDSPGWVIWVVAIALHLHMLYLNDRAAGEDAAATGAAGGLLTATHVGGVWLAMFVVADCLWLAVEHGRLWDTSLAGVVFLASAVAVLVVLTLTAGRALARRSARWPLDRHAVGYGWTAALPVAALVYGGAFVTALVASGDADPLPYLPLLNPVELTLALSIAALALWRRSIIAAAPPPKGSAWLHGRGPLGALAVLAFVVVNTVWLRAAHHLLGVAWTPDALLGSTVVQTGLAILWTVIALGLMVLAHRLARRTLWLVGAGLLGLTVAKLLLVDLGNSGGGARIVAFIVVGVLMLLVGYLAPLPPKVADPIVDEGATA